MQSSFFTTVQEWSKRTFQGALAGVGSMLLACFLFSVLGLFVKASKTEFPLSQIVFYRSLPTVLILGPMMFFRGVSLKTFFPLEQWRRATIGCVSMALSFYGYTKLPLALAMTLAYTNPIFLAIISLIWYKQRLNVGLILCILAGMLGVIILLRPSGLSHENLIGGIAGLGGGFFSALAYMNIQILSGQGEPEWRTVFYFASFSAVYAFMASFANHDHFYIPDVHHLGLILGLGLSGLMGQLCLTHAFSRGNANVTSLFSYSTLLFSSIWGWLFFNEFMDMISMLGGVIVLASGIFATRLKYSSGVQKSSRLGAKNV